MIHSIRAVPNPFLPGQSPFHAKGIVWLASQQAMEARVPGGLTAVCEALPTHAEFLSQQFLATGFYDVFPIQEVAPVAARLSGITPEQYVKAGASAAAESWMKGIHRALLTQNSPAEVCKRYASMMKQLYNFGHPEILEVREDCVEVMTSALPEPLLWWWEMSASGFVEVLVRAAGGRRGGMRFAEPEFEQMQDGVRMYRVPNTTFWN